MSWLSKLEAALFPDVRCEGCNIKLENDFTTSFHEWRCISEIVGYDYTKEAFEPSSRVYFFNEKRRLGL